ncbi:uncharacterized protein A4U43_C10F12630 [Asparagus officinalis]|uniref:Uncharacterized protein n=1 Tax=Asparagus officinalis TaxID=4686 RepID=A0A5P1E457_ASPOF|nr:uncharacterized protein A4U43_C10F12630 [Asparagus officinalis]
MMTKRSLLGGSLGTLYYPQLLRKSTPSTLNVLTRRYIDTRGAARYLEELQHTDLESKIQWAIGDAMLKEGIAARVRVLDISEKKDRIWSLQKQHRQARARLNAGEITQEEFSLEDATFASEVQAEKEAVKVLKQEASAAAAVSDAELH